MILTFGSVATLASRLERSIAPIDRNDAKPTLNCAAAQKVKPSAVANAWRGASIRQAIAGLQPVFRPELHLPPSEGIGARPITSKSTTETSVPEYQANVRGRRIFFERLASESNNEQPPARLNRADIPKRLGVGLHAGTVVWDPTARDCLPYVERAPSHDEVITNPQTIAKGKSTKVPAPVVNHLANIVQNRKADLQARKASVAPLRENISQPAKFFITRFASAPPPSVPSGPDSDSVSPVAHSRRSESLSAFLQDMLVESHTDSSKGALSPVSDEHGQSDYGSDSLGSSAGSSPPGSPNAPDPVISWSQVLAEAKSQPAFLPPDDEIRMTDLKDAFGQLERAIDNEDKYRVSDDAADLLDRAMEHYSRGDIPGAYAAVMEAFDYVTEILVPPKSNEVVSPVDSDYASDSDKPEPLLKSAKAVLPGQATDDDLLSEARDTPGPSPEGFNHDWMNSRFKLDRARARIQATIKRNAGTTWEGRAKALLKRVDERARIDRPGAVDMARDGLKTIAETPRRHISPEY